MDAVLHARGRAAAAPAAAQSGLGCAALRRRLACPDCTGRLRARGAPMRLLRAPPRLVGRRGRAAPRRGGSGADAARLRPVRVRCRRPRRASALRPAPLLRAAAAPLRTRLAPRCVRAAAPRAPRTAAHRRGGTDCAPHPAPRSRSRAATAAAAAPRRALLPRH
jgi:hypothetical protein